MSRRFLFARDFTFSIQLQPLSRVFLENVGVVLRCHHTQAADGHVGKP